MDNKRCIHGKIGCMYVYCGGPGLPRIIKRESIQKLCGYHMAIVNRPFMACILDSFNCEECAKDSTPVPQNVVPFRRSHVR